MLGAITRRQPAPTETRDTGWGTWPGDAPAIGGPVTQSSAMQLLAVAGCVRLITEAVSTLPVDVYRNTGDSRVEETLPRWLKMPTVDLDFVAWASQVLTSVLLHGNAYCVVTRSGVSVLEVIPIDPALVQVSREQGRKVVRISGQIFYGELLHLKGIMLPGADVGLSPLEYARQSFTVGISAQDFAADQFAGALNLPGVIQYPLGVQLDPKQMSETAQTWRRARSKRGRGLPGVIDQGGTWHPTGVTNEAAQFLQSRQWSAAEIAAQVFLVDPREIGIPLSGSTLEYSNAESRQENLLRKALLPWIIRLENALSGLLPQPRFVKLNTSGFLRADSAARWTQYSSAMSINTQAVAIGMEPVLATSEMRDFEDFGPLPADSFAPQTPVVAPVAAANDDNDERVLAMLQAIEARMVATPSEPQQLAFHLPDSTRVELDAGPLAESTALVADQSARTADLTEQLVDTVEALPAAVVDALVRALEPLLVKKPTVQDIQRDGNGRILRVINREEAA